MARRTKAERKQHRQELKQKLRKVVKKIGNFAEGAALLPFVPLMNAKIKKAGQTPARKITDKAKQVFDIIHGSNLMEQENVIEDIASIVKAVVKFFQGRRDELKAKKEAGEELTDGEQNTIDHVDGVENAIKDEAIGVVTEKAKSTLSNPLVLIGGAAVVLFFVMRKK